MSLFDNNKKKVQIGRITLQGFGPSYDLCKSYKALILVTLYKN